MSPRALQKIIFNWLKSNQQGYFIPVEEEGACRIDDSLDIKALAEHIADQIRRFKGASEAEIHAALDY